MFESPPNLVAFTAFLYDQVKIPSQELPDDSPVINTAFCLAQALVNQAIAYASPMLYVEALYNLGAHQVFVLAPNQPDQTWFTDRRKALSLGSVSVGVVSGASNQATSMSQRNPANLEQLTLAELEYLKTPWGRQYIAIAQNFGSGLFGVS